jgi:hypothetical protein
MVGRAVAVIVVAVAVGVLVLRSGATPARVATTTSTTTTTTTTAPRAATTTTVGHSQVKVLVVNDSTTNQVAAAYSTVLQHGGWDVLAPQTANVAPRATSSVYYATNKRADADVIAAAFGIPSSSVFPISSATPVANTGGADVVLVIGADLAAKTPPSTVPTTTTVPKTTTTKAHTTSTT